MSHTRRSFLQSSLSAGVSLTVFSQRVGLARASGKAAPCGASEHVNGQRATGTHALRLASAGRADYAENQRAAKMSWFYDLSPVSQALLATVGTWFVTALGAALVLFTKNFSQKYLDCSLGMAAGVMIAASFWSLLAPAIEMARDDYGSFAWVPALVGFLLGALALRLMDKLLPHLHPGLAAAEGPKTSWHRSTLLVLAITLHNIPEGLAVGVAFGAAPMLVGKVEGNPVAAAIVLAIGIGLQNFPEGTAVALPLRREGMGRLKCLWYGQLSAVVEPVAGVLGALLNIE